jgi:hypothetical protein
MWYWTWSEKKTRIWQTRGLLELANLHLKLSTTKTSLSADPAMTSGMVTSFVGNLKPLPGKLSSKVSWHQHKKCMQSKRLMILSPKKLKCTHTKRIGTLLSFTYLWDCREISTSTLQRFLLTLQWVVIALWESSIKASDLLLHLHHESQWQGALTNPPTDSISSWQWVGVDTPSSTQSPEEILSKSWKCTHQSQLLSLVKLLIAKAAAAATWIRMLHFCGITSLTL